METKKVRVLSELMFAGKIVSEGEEIIVPLHVAKEWTFSGRAVLVIEKPEKQSAKKP